MLTDNRPAAIMLAIFTAENLLAHKASSVCTEIQAPQNIAVAKFAKDRTTAKINHITGITLAGQLRRVGVSTMVPEKSCQGIVHGIYSGTSTEGLMQNLYASGTEIRTPRKMGRSETALITFAGFCIPLWCSIIKKNTSASSTNPKHSSAMPAYV